MSFFSQQKSPKEHGVELSSQLWKAMETIPDELSSIANQEVFHLDDIDTRILFSELVILIYVGQRLALQLTPKKDGERDVAKRREICKALDRHALEFLDDSQEFQSRLDERGMQYHQLFQSHIEEINQGNYEKFFESLQFKFEQFCRGGGDYKGGYLYIGDFFSAISLKTLAGQYWLKGFAQTVKYINEQGI